MNKHAVVKVTGKLAPWAGGIMPVDYGQLLCVQYRNGGLYIEPAGYVYSKDWTHDGSDGDIVAWGLVEPDLQP